MNHHLETEKIIQGLSAPATLLLHSCCAPCSAYVIKYLSDYFKITVFYYNPNITNREEYEKRKNEQIRLISEMPVKYAVNFIEGDYDSDRFYMLVKGREKDRETGERCGICYKMRLSKTAETAEKDGYDYFTTTLTISPLKSAPLINQIGSECSDRWLYSDFKKKDGFKIGRELSEQYSLYRQNYCGCEFSKRESV